jgi:hypothetical protein
MFRSLVKLSTERWRGEGLRNELKGFELVIGQILFEALAPPASPTFNICGVQPNTERSSASSYSSYLPSIFVLKLMSE